MSDLWPDRPIHEWNIYGYKVLSRAEFEALRVVSDKPLAMMCPPYTMCRAKINGRWHAVSRQYSCGMAFYPASPITIRLTASDLEELAA